MFEAHLICEISYLTLVISFYKTWTCRSTTEFSQDIVVGRTDTAN